MKRASKYFVESEKQRIEQAVAEAEAKTSAEIVPVLASSSGRYDRAEDIAGVWLSIIAMGVAWAVLQTQSAEAAQWGSTWARFELPILILAVIAGYVLGTTIATYSWTLRRLFTPKKHMTSEVEERAGHVFFDRRVHHTEGGTGLLIYISLFEHGARILADQAAHEKLGQAALDDLCNELIDGIKKGDLATALCEVIKDAGDRLEKVLPRTDGGHNEIENTLVILD